MSQKSLEYLEKYITFNITKNIKKIYYTYIYYVIYIM